MPSNPFSSEALAEQPATTPAPAPTVNPFSREALRLDEADPLSRVSVRTGIVQDPMRAARILRAQDRLKLPADLIDRNLDGIETEMARSDFDPDAFAKTSPVVARWLGEQPEHMAISQHDLPNLARLEQMIAVTPTYRLTPTGGVLETSADGKFAFPYANVQEFYATEYRGREARMALDAGERARRAKDLRAAFGPLANVAAGAFQSWGSTLEALQTGPADPSKFALVDQTTQASQDLSPGIWGDLQRGAGGLAADVPLMLAGGHLGRGVQSLAKLGRVRSILATAAAVQPLAIREGVNTGREHGFWNGLAAWGIETVVPAAFGRTGVERALIPGITPEVMALRRTAAKQFLVDAGLEGTEEAATEFVHAMHEVASGINPHALDGDQLARRLMVAGALGAAAGGAFNVPELVHRMGETDQTVAGHQFRQRMGQIPAILRGQNTKTFMQEMGEIATASGADGAMKHSPERVQQLIASMPDVGRSHIYVDPVAFTAYAESQGLNPVAFAQLAIATLDEAPSAGETYHEAMITGAPLAIPVASYMVNLAGTEHHAALSAMARLSPGDLSVAESDAHLAEIQKPAKVYTPEEQAAATEAGKSVGDIIDPIEASGQKVHDDVARQLEAAGARPEDAHIQALLYSEAFKTLGQRSGTDPFALYQPYRLKITRELPGIVQKGTTDYTDTLLDRLRKGEIPSEGKARGESLFEYLRRKGGLVDQGTELSTLGVDDRRKPGQRNIIQENGRLLDAASEDAYESGFISEPTPNALLAAIGEEAAGNPVYQDGAGDSQAQAMRDGLLELQDYLGRLGVDLNAQDNEAVKALLLEQEQSGGGGQTLEQGADLSHLSPEARAYVESLSPEDQAAVASSVAYFAKHPDLTGDLGNLRMVVDFARRKAGKVYNQGDGRLWKTKTEEVLAKLPNKGPSEQVRKTLINNGVNERELFWLGIDDLLKSKETVTKEEIAALVAEPKVKMEETVRGGEYAKAASDARRELEYQTDRVTNITTEFIQLAEEQGHQQLWRMNRLLSLNDGPEAITAISDPRLRAIAERIVQARTEQRRAEDVVNSVRGTSTKFHAYTLPGGENYRELLITIPSDNSYKASDLTPITPGSDPAATRPDLFWYFRAPDNVFQIPKSKYSTELEAIKYITSTKEKGPSNAYQSSHWNEKNVLLHTRFNERQTQGGEKVLHVEEIQSDWHQAGREKGYKGPFLAEMEVLTKKIDAMHAAAEADMPKHMADPAFIDEFNRLTDQRREMSQVDYVDLVPEAPFAKTWEEIGFKRMIRQAVDQGITRITWTTGEQQAERYDLSKQVDQIRYKRNNDGTFEVWASNKDGGSLSDETDWHNLKPEQIAEKVGKDVAQRIVDGVGKDSDGDMVLEGVNLKVGGEGMKAAYDHRLVSIANKIGKKYGVKVANAYLDDPRKTLSNNSKQHAAAIGAEPVHSLEITPDMAKDAMGGMQLLFQPARGKIEIAPDRQLSITMLRHADRSTFLHETGHLFLEVLGDLATAPDATPDVAAMWADVLTWLEVSERSQISTKQHEQWAEGFETYLMTGKAPSSALHTAFSRFKAWLVSVYKKLAGMRIQLSPDITRVFDRILAGDDAIAAAQARQGTAATFAKASDAGMTEPEFAAYKASVEAARVEAEDRLRAQLMAVYQREATKQWQEERDRVLTETAESVNQRAEYQAISTFQSGAMPDGRSLPDDLQGLKLSRLEIVDIYGTDALMRLPGRGIPKRINKNNRGKDIYSDDGMSLSAAAKMFGYRDGQALFEALVNASDRRALIETTADKIMAEHHPDPLTDGSLDERAAFALHNDMASDVLVAELRSLAQRTGQTPAPLELLRTKANERVSGYLVKNLKPHRYEVAERTAFRRVEEALARGDHREAFKQKQIQILNHEMFRAAQAAIDDAQSGYNYLKKFAEPKTRAKIGKAGGWDWTVTYPDGQTKAFDNENDARAEVKDKGGEWDQTSTYLDQIDGLLAQFQFTKESIKALKRRDSLRAWVEKQAADGQSVAISAALWDQVRVINWREMTVVQINDLRDAVQSIAHLATFKNQLMKAQQRRDYLETREEALVQLAINVPTLAPVKRSGEQSTWDAGMKRLDGFLAAHRKLASYARQMDGGKNGGIWWDILVRPLNEAGDREVTMRAEAAQAVAALWKAWSADGRHLKQVVNVPGMEAMNLETRLAVALNWGNEGNRARLLQAEEWTEEQGRGVIDTLDATDWAFVQGVWDHINSYWSEIRSLEKRMNGVAPDKVAASPFQTKHGVQRGGYYPVKYDSQRSAGDGRGGSGEALYTLGKATASSTRRGHVEERGRGTGQTMRLDVEVIAQHISQVVHDITHREAVRDVGKVLKDKAVAQEVLKHLGPAAVSEMRQTVEQVAVSDLNDNQVDRTLRAIRNGVSIATMGFNLTSAAMQLTGASQSMQLVGVGNFSRAVTRMFGDASRGESSFAFVQAKSEFMRNRSTTAVREVNEATNKVKGGEWRDKLTTAAYYLMQRTQWLVDVPTWMAAYENALEAEHDDATAVQIANQAVIDTQGSGMTKDLAGVQRSKATQLFTVYYSYFSALFNRTAESWGEARRAQWTPGAIAKLATDHLLLYSVPAVMAVLIRSALTGGGDDSDKERPGLAAKILKEHLGMMMGNLVIVRDLGGSLTDSYGYKGPAGLMGVEAASRLIIQAKQGELDAGLAEAAAKMTGLGFRLPVTQVVRTIEGLRWMHENESLDLRRLMFGPPK